MAATKYKADITTNGTKDFTTHAAWDTYIVGEWVLNSFDDEVIGTFFDTGDFTDEWTITATLNPTLQYPLILRNAPGHLPTIDATGNPYGIHIAGGPLHVRFKGIEIHSATSMNIRSISSFSNLRYWESMYSRDCTADNDNTLYATGGGQRFYRCRFEGTGLLYISGGTFDFTRCSFSGGDVDKHVINLVGQRPDFSARFTSCKFDGSSLDAGQPIIEQSTTTCGTLEFYHCSAFGGDYFLHQLNAGQQAPATLRAINNIFDSQDTGVFYCAGYFQYPDEGDAYILEANCFYNTTNFLVDANGTYTNLTELRAAGYDVLERSIAADPKLTIATGAIAADSPCIMAGIGAGVLLGYDGDSYAQIYERPSIGDDAQWDDDSAPVAPTFAGITGFTNNGDGSFTFSWTAGTSVNRYVLALHTSDPMGSFDSYVVGTAPDGETQRTVFLDVNDALLVGGTTYYGGVRAEGSGGAQDTNTEVISAVLTETKRVGGPHITLLPQDPQWIVATAEGSATTLYTCPASKNVKVSASITNTHNAAVDVTLYKVPSGQSAGAIYRRRDQHTLDPAGTPFTHYEEGIEFELAPGDTIQGFASEASKVSVDFPTGKRVTIE